VVALHKKIPKNFFTVSTEQFGPEIKKKNAFVLKMCVLPKTLILL
jgi:hypothetical protein